MRRRVEDRSAAVHGARRCRDDVVGAAARARDTRVDGTSPGRHCRNGRPWRPRNTAAPSAGAALDDAGARQADRFGHGSESGSARWIEGGMVGCRRGRVEHAHDLHDAPDRQGAGLDAL